ncbi:transcriptional regulator, GntR family [Actinobacteria bacterium OK074]|nr:transcriptional regulator, GntR family [Actinobacteria bacterium OK074]
MTPPVPRTDTTANDRRPLHERIAADLRDEIMSGELALGASLPSTARLKERFDASSATVQKALHLLKDEGLVVGRAGSAVTVREHRQRTLRPAEFMAPAEPGEPYRWLTEVTKRDGRAHSTLREVAEVVPPADVAAALGLGPGETAVLRPASASTASRPASPPRNRPPS